MGSDVELRFLWALLISMVGLWGGLIGYTIIASSSRPCPEYRNTRIKNLPARCLAEYQRIK